MTLCSFNSKHWFNFPFSALKMLYFIGLGLGDAKDISVKGLEAIKKCKRVYLEAYTSLLTVGKEILVSGFVDLHILQY